MKIRIPVHSFVDLITNSSSEVYVTADRKTIEVVKEAVNAILKAGGSPHSADDLFVFGLTSVDGGYGEFRALEVEAKDLKNAKLANVLNKLQEAFTAEEIGNGG